MTESKHPLKRATVTLVNIAAVALVFVAALLGWDRLKNGASAQAPAQTLLLEVSPTPQQEKQAEVQVGLPSLASDSSRADSGINRIATMDTTIPTRPRVDVTTYTVEQGDSIFSIADIHNLKPETILWGNFDILEDNPHLLKAGQELNILPVDGTYYQWHDGDNFGQVADFFRVEPQAIVEYPGNRFDLTQSFDNPAIEDEKWLIIPGGQREIKDWGPPAITRDNPASAAFYGAGHCGAVYEGAIGTFTFVWPTTSRQISGYGYDPVVHAAIDIGGAEGNAIYAVDNGVVVYAGWSDFGYGYLIVIDHGTGWQSAYAHLSAVGVSCGQSVFQGTMIGGLGNTGNSSGAHLHFEMIYNGVKVNPINFVQ